MVVVRFVSMESDVPAAKIVLVVEFVSMEFKGTLQMQGLWWGWDL